MNEANWPIRIGGEYKTQSPGLFRRVIAIDGDTIHVELVYAEDGDVLKRDGLSSWLFRACSHPEDQSPVQQLVDALAMILPLAEDYLRSAPGHPDNAKLEDARGALAKAAACGYTPTVETPEITEPLNEKVGTC